ncbi:MAG: tRNA (adenosine(37)-N6)-threonylcarbamoyltransferase complex dimerization subunit type 1 TsaB [Pseudonocardiales bacterium]|nr:tRNA (adenosine(37)-N6)-threonylcarbamoyltransferase complex dimerization subunit type 1 TsaB [Pseudonocardiales bacterium]MBV9028758.1 tRNA (adenosine(37)-N6)-threonylcarbamoyltransferase complex dimerization subunit type 1 TsaB [Pseudonocardiales bacterium]
MTVTLAIETSSINYGVALCTPREVVVCQTVRRDAPSFQGFGCLVWSALRAVGYEFQDVERLAVDVGPGNLGSVRTGVAYANGLAFSLRRLIYCADSLTLLAAEVSESEPGEEHVLCLRNAGGGNVYAGLFRHGRALGMRRGPLGSVVTSLAGGLARVSVAGTFRKEVEDMLTNTLIRDTGIEFPNVSALHRLLVEKGSDTTGFVPVASPLNDSSSVFGE